MNQNARHKLFFFILFGVSMVLLTSTEAQQREVIIRCGEAYTEGTVLPDPFPGAYYLTTQIGVLAPDYMWNFQIITDEGRSDISVSLPNQQADTPLAPLVSPDGSKIVFRPLTGNNLTIWRIDTEEVAVFELEASIADYLTQFERYGADYLGKLVWEDSNTLIIQYRDYRGLTIPEAQFRLNVLENPLRLTTLNSQTTQADVNSFVQTGNIAPEGVEQTLVIEGDAQLGLQVTEQTDIETPRRTYRIYDNRANNVVFEILAVDENRTILAGLPVWLDTRDTFLYVERDEEFSWRLVEIEVADNFARNSYLNEQLTATFGTAGTVSNLYVSNNRQSIGFTITSKPDEQFYEVKYTPSTREIVAVCRNTRIGGNGFPFFPPDDEHLAYWDGSIVIFELATGNSYRLPGPGFVGWIDWPADDR